MEAAFAPNVKDFWFRSLTPSFGARLQVAQMTFCRFRIQQVVCDAALFLLTGEDGIRQGTCEEWNTDGRNVGMSLTKY